MTLHDVCPYPTLRAQAARLSGTEDSSQPQALAARRDGAAAPLFAVPTGTGHIAYAFELGAHMDADVPVYALPWPQTIPASMDALAAYMVSLMQAKQAHGPYRLLGVSSGGLLAYAMAQLLAELDEPVEFVGLLDSDNPQTRPVQETQEERARHLLVGQLLELVQQDAYSVQDDLQQAVRLLEEKAPITDWAELVACAEALPALQALAQQEKTTIAQFAASCLRMADYEKLWPTYLPQRLPAPLKLHLFYATEEAQLPPPLGWDRLLPSEQVNVVPVAGTHTSMIRPPHINALGRAISHALSSAHRVLSDGHAPALVLQASRADNTPIVCVPGAGASITSFVELGIAFGSDQTLIGMQPRGVDGRQLPYGSVERAAAAYLYAVRSQLPPSAPVHLLGHSFGGWVVFEMARLLKAVGTNVSSLTLIDVDAPDDAPGMRDEIRDAVVNRFLEALSLHVDRPLPIDGAQLRQLSADALIESLHGLMVGLKLMPRSSRPEALRGTFYSFARACRTRYCPDTPYDGPVHLVLVTDTRLDEEADARQRQGIEARWQPHAPALTVWRGPGNHMSVLDPPHVGALAHWWRASVLGPADAIARGALPRHQERAQPVERA